MPYLDVCRLFFKPSATIEDETSVFSKEWRMTLEYVLQRSGLDALYTSRLGIEFDLWVFLREFVVVPYHSPTNVTR